MNCDICNLAAPAELRLPEIDRKQPVLQTCFIGYLNDSRNALLGLNTQNRRQGDRWYLINSVNTFACKTLYKTAPWGVALLNAAPCRVAASMVASNNLVSAVVLRSDTLQSY